MFWKVPLFCFFLLFTPPVLAQVKPKDTTPKKTEKKPPQKPKKIEVPTLPPLDPQRETLELANQIGLFREIVKNKAVFLVQNLQKFTTLDRQIRLAKPFISGEFLRGGLEQPSESQGLALRKFWVTTPQVADLLAKIKSLSEVAEDLQKVLAVLKQAGDQPTKYGLPFLFTYHQRLRAIRDLLENLESSSPPSLLGSIFKNFRKSIEKQKSELDLGEKKIEAQMIKAFQKVQLKDQQRLAGFLKAFPDRKGRAIIELSVYSPETIYQDNLGHLYFWTEKDGWKEGESAKLLMVSWRILKVSGNFPAGGMSRKFCQSTLPKIAKTLPLKEKIYSVLLPVLPGYFDLTRTIVGEKKPGLAALMDRWKKEGLHKNPQAFLGKAFLEDDFISRLEELLGLYKNNRVLKFNITLPPGTSANNLSLEVAGKKLDLSSPVVVLDSSKTEVILKGKWGKKPLWEKLISLTKKQVTVNYSVREQVLGSSSSSKLDIEALDKALKQKLNPAFYPEEEVLAQPQGRVLFRRFADNQRMAPPFSKAVLPSYRYLFGQEVLLPLSLKSEFRSKIQKAFQKFDQKYKNFSLPYQVPDSLVKRAIGHKTPLEEVRSSYSLYFEALRQNKRSEALALYSEISGDRDGEKVVGQWLKYSRLIEKYKTQSKKEEQTPFTPLLKNDDSPYLQNENIPVDGKLSKAKKTSKYDGAPSKEELAWKDKIPGSLEGLSAGEKQVQTLLQEQRDNNQNQRKELKAFLQKDELAPENNGGNLINVWVNKRVITLTLSTTSRDKNLWLEVKINGKYLPLDSKGTTAKISLTTKAIKITIPLQIGYNTLSILARTVGSNNYNSGKLTLSNCIRGKASQPFYLNKLEVATLAIYFPPQELR